MIQQMMLLGKFHLTFESWFIRQFQQGLLPEGLFDLAGIRNEYLNLCWKEEYLWKEWCNNIERETFSSALKSRNVEILMRGE